MARSRRNRRNRRSRRGGINTDDAEFLKKMNKVATQANQTWGGCQCRRCCGEEGERGRRDRQRRGQKPLLFVQKKLKEARVFFAEMLHMLNNTPKNARKKQSKPSTQTSRLRRLSKPKPKTEHLRCTGPGKCRGNSAQESRGLCYSYGRKCMWYGKKAGSKGGRRRRRTRRRRKKRKSRRRSRRRTRRRTRRTRRRRRR